MSDLKPLTEPSMEEILATVRRIIAEDESTPGRSTAGSRLLDGDVLELTEAIDPDGSMRHIPPFSTARRNPNDAPLTARPDERIGPAPPRSAAAKQEAGPPPRMEPVAGGIDRAAEREPGVLADGPRRGGDRTLDDVVRELLRPMLQSWLDENLPGLVERAVRAEVARVSEPARPPRAAAGGSAAE